MNDILSFKEIVRPAQFYFLCNATDGCHAEQECPQFDTRHDASKRRWRSSVPLERGNLPETKRKATSNSLPSLAAIENHKSRTRKELSVHREGSFGREFDVAQAATPLDAGLTNLGKQQMRLKL